MSKEIKCTVCRCKAGEIRDASLLKGLRFICEKCDNRRLEICVELTKLQKESRSSGADFISELLGGSRRGF